MALDSRAGCVRPVPVVAFKLCLRNILEFRTVKQICDVSRLCIACIAKISPNSGMPLKTCQTQR
jgi:hypothetical protein